MNENLNVLVVYRISDNRIVHSRSIQYGLPRIEDLSEAVFDSSASIFDSSSMDYKVGVMNYEAGDFDDDGILTSAACAKYGVSQSQVSKYTKDLEILVPITTRCDHLVFDSSSGDITETLLSVENLQRYLKIGIAAVNGTSKTATDPITGLDIYQLPATPGSSYIDFEIAKYDAEGVAMTGEEDTNRVWIYINGGKIVGPRFRDLVYGSTTVRVWIPDESITFTIQAASQETDGEGKDIIEASYSIHLNGFEE